MADVVVGIDLGTTNSEVAAFLDGKVRVLPVEGDPILPSVVGLGPDGTLLVGDPARNQLALYPERTVRSIKRLMGTTQTVSMGDRSFTPPEVSAFILKKLTERAEASLGAPVRKAVVTVPAYFSDAQRQATRDAGAIAGLEVLRILNEPTAAALAYGEDGHEGKTVLVYDLGGGTFDVSVVRAAGDVTEVLASHGDTHLGGDDFDQLLLEHVHGRLIAGGGPDLHGDRRAMNRLLRAVEDAKKLLSYEPWARIREEHLAQVRDVPVHLDIEVSREEYEKLVEHLLERTINSVHKALSDAGKRPAELDAILLVGGATRTPLVSEFLERATGIRPRQDLHPDLCVALGAGVLASRLAGHDIEKVLVDVSPYSFGPSHLGMLDGQFTPFCYRPIIRRNTPLPVTRTEAYMTVADGQEAVRLDIYQGDDPSALHNVPIGSFSVEGLSKVPAGNEILVRMDLDLDGILRVTGVEKRTGLSKAVTIERATTTLSPEDVEKARARMRELGEEWEDPGASDDTEDAAEDEEEGEDDETREEGAESEASSVRSLLDRSRALLPRMGPEDREEAISLHERIEEAAAGGNAKDLETLSQQLEDILFFVEET